MIALLNFQLNCWQSCFSIRSWIGINIFFFLLKMISITSLTFAFCRLYWWNCGDYWRFIWYFFPPISKHWMEIPDATRSHCYRRAGINASLIRRNLPPKIPHGQNNNFWAHWKIIKYICTLILFITAYSNLGWNLKIRQRRTEEFAGKLERIGIIDDVTWRAVNDVISGAVTTKRQQCHQ